MMHKILFAALALAGALSAQEPAAKPEPAKAAAKAPFEQRAALYPMTTCIVSGEALDADAVTFTADGTTFKTCCAKCQAKVEKDPATYKAKLEAASMKAQLAHYPLKKCVISGEELGGMGEPVQLMLDGTLVQLCCKSCVAKAKANSAAMVQKVATAAYAEQRKSYPLETCVVGGEKLGDDAVDVMFGTTLARLCCTKCAAKFEKDPTPFVQKLHEAWTKAGGKEHGDHGEKHDGKEHGEKHDGEHGKGK